MKTLRLNQYKMQEEEENSLIKSLRQQVELPQVANLPKSFIMSPKVQMVANILSLP
jgi:hypothetical protein